MSTPLTADQFVAALRAEGLTVIEHRSWRTHNRNAKGAWGPVNGVILHHTVSRGDLSSVNLCYDGYAELPGPLCHGVITKDGKVYLVGNGRTNHAGGGDPDVLAAVAAESYGSAPPRPDVGNSDGVDGNRRFYGFECVNMGDGKDPWPPVQVDAMVRASAALCRKHEWGYRSAIAHREWSDDKSDPAGPGMPTMPDMRAKIGQRLAHPASWNPASTLPDPDTGTPMSVKPDRQQLIRTEDVSLLTNVPYTVYWTTEYQDDGSEHGAGGKTLATDVAYSTVLSLSLTGLSAGGIVEVCAVEEDATGTETGSGPLHQVVGHGGAVATSVPLLGIVGQRYAIKLVNRSAATVTMTEARASSQFWPNV